MTYTEKELNQFLHGISLSLLSKKSAQHWRYDEETAKEIEWLEALERKVRADKADRKHKPTISKMEQVEDEPLTCSFSDCDNFKNPDYARCIECKRKQIELKTEPNSSEIPNNCEHITEDGVTCAKYPACDDCLDNPLNKVKGSKRLLKGSEKPNKFSADVQTYITEDRDTRILDAWQVKQMQGGKE